MAEAYIGEIRMFGGSFAPNGWALCNGQLLSIAQNQALFSILGTTYGGDGVRTFGLPNLQGRLPLHWGTSTTGTTFVQGEAAGAENATLLVTNLPAHSHSVSMPVSDQAADLSDPTGAFLASPNVTTSGDAVAAYTKTTTARFAGAVQGGSVGSGTPFSIMQPYLSVTFIIALVGIFPSRS